jgi:hypothetical protein
MTPKVNKTKTNKGETTGLVLALVLLFACEQTPTAPPTPTSADATIVEPPVPFDAGPTAPDVGFARPDTGIVITDTGPGIQECSPALEILPAQKAAIPLALVNFQGKGGTEAYHFELRENNSGAVLNSQSGAYLSGTLEQTSDVIILSDLGCLGTATATVDILSRIDVKPLQATIPPGGQVFYDVRGGSGQYHFAVLPRSDNTLTGTITEAGVYQAPNQAGQDIIRIFDKETEDSADAYIQIEDAAQLFPSPPILYVPVESTLVLAIEGGSGYFDVTASTPSFAYRDNVLTASIAGESTLDVIDRYTRQTTQIKAYALRSQTMTSTRSGSYVISGAVVNTGDINQDGYIDVAVAWAEINHTAEDSGAVFIYQGQAQGLDPNPVRILSQGGRRAQFGRSMTIADLDGDGMLDLVVGAIRADLGARDNGGVFIYSGQSNAFFSAQPTRAIGGLNAYDLSGFAVEACDFNADGMMDLAIGAAYAEDRFRRTRSNDQGSVYIHLGHSSGFLDAPDFSLYGDLPLGDGTFEGRPYLYLGRALAAGDFNGDGACDLAAGTYTYDAGPSNTDDGLVLLYRGVPKTNNTNGGLTPFPVRGYAATVAPERSSHFGRNLAAGDLDNDQADELIVNQFRAENAAAGGVNRGAIRIYQELDLPDTPMLGFKAVETATLSWFGEDNNDQSGWYARVADYDGDLLNDLIIGNYADELPGGLTNAGTVVVYTGQSGFLPDTTTSTPARWIAGVHAYDYFGMYFDVVGDLDQDGTNDIVAMAPYDDTYGINLGVPYVIPGDETKPFELLQMPGFPGGDQFGAAMDFVGDVNGDGHTDLLMGAPQFDSARIGLNCGAAVLYFGSATGFGEQPDIELVGFRGHSGSDYLGTDVAAAGDFNSDGHADFAVVARYEDVPSSFSNVNYEVLGDCGAAKTNTGAVYIFLGNDTGTLSTEPAFIYFGPQASADLTALAGGLDVDNDNYDDLIVTGRYWDQPGLNNTGGFAVIKGRPAANDGRIRVICDTPPLMYGLEANDQLGFAASRAGDIDGDLCDDFAVGSREEDNGNTNQGTVRVVFGWGPNCGDTEARMLTLESRARASRAGTSIAGGLDVDGDSVPDLVVGGNDYRSNNSAVGGVWLITGAFLNSLTPEPVSNAANATFYGFTDPSNPLRLILHGETSTGQFGASVALVQELSGPGRAGIAVGAPFGDFSGTALTGEAHLFRFKDGVGLQKTPSVSFVGQTAQVSGEAGRVVRAGRLNGQSVIGVGAYQSARPGNFSGAAYLLHIRP